MINFRENMGGALGGFWEVDFDCTSINVKQTNNYKDASKPVSKHFNLPGHYFENMVVCGLSLCQGNT